MGSLFHKHNHFRQIVFRKRKKRLKEYDLLITKSIFLKYFLGDKQKDIEFRFGVACNTLTEHESVISLVPRQTITLINSNLLTCQTLFQTVLMHLCVFRSVHKVNCLNRTS